MSGLQTYTRVGAFFARFFWHTWTGRGAFPTVYTTNAYREAQDFLSPVLGFRHTAVIHPERCPKTGPAVFCANHLKLDDPFFAYHAVQLATDWKHCPRLMSRDDFFTGTPLKSRVVDGDKLMNAVGTYLISRGHITLSQLRPFVNLLKNGGSFVIFPGHTRSCSGVFMEYRGAFKEPGGVSFFINQAQRARPDVRVAAVPIVRTYNPVSKRSAMVFGESLFLEGDADREAQRAFDYGLTMEMSRYVELNVPQVLSAVLWLRCLHGMETEISLREIREILSPIFATCGHAYVDPEARTDLGGGVLRTVDFLAEREMLTRNRDRVTVNRKAVLSVPDLTTKYRHLNPVKYLANQLIHLGGVVEAIEGIVLGGARAKE